MLSKIELEKIERIKNIKTRIVKGLTTVILNNLLPDIDRECLRIYINDDIVYVGILNVYNIKTVLSKDKECVAFQLQAGTNDKNKTHDFEKRLGIINVDNVYVGLDIHGIVVKNIGNWNMSVLKQIDRIPFKHDRL